ncbi:hypothetical protein [Rhizobium sp. Leaf311]|nr:hypothetical protein [Rhizobium sp. Leaf311]
MAKVESAELCIDVVEFAKLAKAMDESPTALLDRLLAEFEKLERVQDFP